MKSPINFVDMDEEEERERIGEREKKRVKEKEEGGKRKGPPFSQVPESAPDWDCSKTFF